ncbi:hypothetical protein GIB67_012213, partial [Kingdonia uniflora]
QSSSPQLPERNPNLLLDHLFCGFSSYNNFIFISKTHLSKLWFVNFLVSLKPISSESFVYPSVSALETMILGPTTIA